MILSRCNMLDFNVIEKNIADFKDKVSVLSGHAGREVKIVAATKTQPKELIDFIAKKSLLTDVGENRVQEFVEKFDPDNGLSYHIIGQLQSNKVKYIVGKASLIHSLDRYSLADEIEKQSEKHDVITDCLIEINMGSELTKGGVAPEELFTFADGLRKYNRIRVKGIMSVMPNVEIASLIAYYKKFAMLFEKLEGMRGGNLSPDICSCGMSGDYAPAIEYGGSNLVRPGRILFGERNQ